MTEEEWVIATDPMPMLGWLEGKAGNRKMLLFGCACVRRVWHLLNDERSRVGVEASEGYADALITTEAFLHAAAQSEEAMRIVYNSVESYAHVAAYAVSSDVAFYLRIQGSPRSENFRSTPDPVYVSSNAAEAVAYAIAATNEYATLDRDLDTEQSAHCSLIRDIFGNPFSPVKIDPAWLTSDVVALATGIYDEKAFDRLPILADALQDAGCDNQDILNHCRSEGPHVRGCWVVDLILGKS